MNKDYTYCLNKGNCIHRKECKRWIGNYSDKEVHNLYTEDRFISEVNDTLCVPNYKDKDCTNDFGFLDRLERKDNG